MPVHSELEKPSSPAHLFRWLERNENWISFEQFMTAALYDPEAGYYSAKIRDVGRTGDFSTSAQSDSLLAKAIARWALQQRRILQIGWRWHLIEMGGGNGDMAATILTNLGLRGRMGLTYHLVEISRPLRERQQKKLAGFRVRWHESASEALQVAKGKALLFSNELVDAYPCLRLLYREGEWREMGISEKDGQIQESSRPLSVEKQNDLRSSVFIWPSQPSPQIVEVHHSYRRDLLKIAENLVCGSLLTIDYGDCFPAIYHRQPAGTVRGYFHHLRVEGADLYARVGQQDLTADVNFTDLENWGIQAGLINDRLETQRDFILRQLGKITPQTTPEARLLDPVGAGSAFKVLQQSQRMAGNE